MKKKLLLLASALIMMLSLSGCVPGDGTSNAGNPAGLLWGIWHGWIAPVSLIISIFKPEISIYESANSGWWYDLGYYAAIISGFGGLSLIRKKSKK